MTIKENKVRMASNLKNLCHVKKLLLLLKYIGNKYKPRVSNKQVRVRRENTSN